MVQPISAWIASSFVRPVRPCELNNNNRSFIERGSSIHVTSKNTRVRLVQGQAISSLQSSLQANKDWNGEKIDTNELISLVKFNENGLVPAIAQQWDTNEILMMAWMNAESIRETLKSGRAIYYSRSRKQLWRKGDTSGQIQQVRDVVLDCDGDTILILVDQLGVACHTGRRSCFYTAFRPPFGKPQIIADVLMDPKELYKGTSK